MAITTDTGAKKIENSENWRNIFGIHNDTVDAYDALAEQKDEEIGIVVKGNKTAHTGGAAAGQYIILRNSTITGCDDGLYTAAQAIPYDTVIDSTYLTAVSGGGLNALNASITTYQGSGNNTSRTIYFNGKGKVIISTWYGKYAKITDYGSIKCAIKKVNGNTETIIGMADFRKETQGTEDKQGVSVSGIAEINVGDQIVLEYYTSYDATMDYYVSIVCIGCSIQ